MSEDKIKTLPNALEFCKNCGTMVDLPIHGEIYECSLCGCKLSVLSTYQHNKNYSFDFSTRVSVTSKEFVENKGWLADYHKHQKKLKGLKESEIKMKETRQIITQRCSNPDCNSTQAYYHTMQTRSADEGATMFFQCIKCNLYSKDHQYMRNSCQTFRELLKQGGLAIPGAFNGLVSRCVAENGFKACYISGAAISGANGVPDIGLVTLDHFCKIIREVHLSSGLPVIADADTGFGEGEMCSKTVWEYYSAGASGLHIEDQQFPKRCGHLDNKTLVTAEDFCKKIEIAVNASKSCSNGEFVICARTDARGVEGLEAAIKRAKLYVDAGADMIFPEGLQSAEEFKLVAQALKNYGPKGGPFLLANMTEFGKTPYLSLEEFSKLGYHCVIYPVSTLRIAMKAVDSFLKDLKKNGHQEKNVPQMQTRQELYSLLGYTPGKEWIYPNSTVLRNINSK